MPEGKPAGIRCIQLTPGNRCKLFGMPERPLVCSSLRPTKDMCGTEDEHAYGFLRALEEATKPVDAETELR